MEERLGSARHTTDLKNKIAQFTNMNSRECYTGTDWTGAAGCKQILLQILPLELKKKVAELLDLKLDDLVGGEQQVEEYECSQSQAFTAFSQSQGSDTVQCFKIISASTTTKHQKIIDHIDWIFCVT